MHFDSLLNILAVFLLIAFIFSLSWRRYTRFYGVLPETGPYDYRYASGKIGGLLYRGTIHVAFKPAGLYLYPIFPFYLFNRQALLIPWNQLVIPKQEPRGGVLSGSTEFTIVPQNLPLRFYGKVAEQIAARLTM